MGGLPHPYEDVHWTHRDTDFAFEILSYTHQELLLTVLYCECLHPYHSCCLPEQLSHKTVFPACLFGYVQGSFLFFCHFFSAYRYTSAMLYQKGCDKHFQDLYFHTQRYLEFCFHQHFLQWKFGYYDLVRLYRVQYLYLLKSLYYHLLFKPIITAKS